MPNGQTNSEFYQGGRVSAVRTTGIFCRPTCGGRPKPENVDHYALCAEALLAGYRACRSCHPLGKPDAARGLERGTNAALQEFAGASPAWREGAPVVHVTRLDTPIGPMIAAATDSAIVMFDFAQRRMLRTQFRRLWTAQRCNFVWGSTPLVERAARQLDEYLDGRRRDFDVPLEAEGTAFQMRVWRELQRIPAGATRSYAQVARALGRPEAVRAVARANGDNRIAILIPCHRVVGSDGSLTGYSGGLERKRLLLELEARAS